MLETGSDSSANDISPVSGILTMDDGESSGIITLVAVNDSIPEVSCLHWGHISAWLATDRAWNVAVVLKMWKKTTSFHMCWCCLC